MTDNNWITPEWIEKIDQKWYEVTQCSQDNCFECSKKEPNPCETYTVFLAAEINKEIKNILESAEKRECKTCKRAQYTINCQECLACYFETKKTYPNWTPKEGK